MTEHMDEAAYAELQSALEAGTAQLGIPRARARHFFTHVSSTEVAETTGKSNLAEKSLVLITLICAIALGVFCCIVIARDFGTTALLAIPLAGIFWTVIAGFTTEMGGTGATLVAGACVIVMVLLLPSGYQIVAASFTGSLLLYRIAHLLAAWLLLRLIASSYPAFDMLHQHITIDRHADGD